MYLNILNSVKLNFSLTSKHLTEVSKKCQTAVLLFLNNISLKVPNAWFIYTYTWFIYTYACQKDRHTARELARSIIVSIIVKGSILKHMYWYWGGRGTRASEIYIRYIFCQHSKHFARLISYTAFVMFTGTEQSLQKSLQSKISSITGMERQSQWDILQKKDATEALSLLLLILIYLERRKRR